MSACRCKDHPLSEIIYRTPAPSEAATLAELSRTTFCDTFAHLYSAEDLNAFLDTHKTEAAFSRTLTDGRHIFQVAEQGGVLVGYCKLGLDGSLPGLPKGWRDGIELKELYLSSSVQGAGVGPALMAWAMDEAQARNAPTMVLSVWSGNDRAQRFYRKRGWQHIADTFFMVGNHRDDEYLYGLRLEATA
jgi:diamine N-acetyltransferase